MKNLFSGLDGSGRSPRNLQKLILDWLEDNWADADIFVIRAPVGVGKAFIAATVGLGAVGPNLILTPNNALVDQYAADYPQTINTIKGRDNYKCGQVLPKKRYKCSRNDEVCALCPYMQAIVRWSRGELTGTNSQMYAVMRRSQSIGQPRTIILDEAHLILDLLRVSTDMSLPLTVNGDTLADFNTRDVWLWLKRNAKGLSTHDKGSHLKDLLRNLELEPENCVTYRENNRLQVRSLSIPKSAVKGLQGKNKTILLSATLSEEEVTELVGGNSRVRYIDVPSEFPIENRRVVYAPVYAGRGGSMDFSLIARKIHALYKQNNSPNTIVHCTYGMQQQLVQAFRELYSVPILWNEQNPGAKTDNIRLMRRATGYIWFASGCAEGIDMKEDLCRLQIFPQLIWPNKVDPYVVARLAKADGRFWYQWQVLRWLMQATGRSTRSACDRSVNVILDPLWPDLFEQSNYRMPGWFRESVDTSNFGV